MYFHSSSLLISSATSARVIGSIAYELESNQDPCILAITCDKTSNGPHLFYPDPSGSGGKGESENWVWDNFNFDPFDTNAMIETAENVAHESQITWEEQNEVALLRFQQYQEALHEDAAFHRRYMISPLEVKDTSGRKVIATVLDDEGIYKTTAEGLSHLRPVKEDETVCFGSQTHLADGNCVMVLNSKERAQALNHASGVTVQVLSFGQARAKKGFITQATEPAARQALERSEIDITKVKSTKTHNPFAVNDINFAREMGIALDAFNNYGSSLIFGHPHVPTGMRLIIELIEELVLLGDG